MNHKPTYFQIHKVLNICIQNNFPFYCYRLPDTQEIVCGVQKKGDVMQFSELEELPEEEGFLMAPFDSNEGLPIFFLRPDWKVGEGEGTDEHLLWLENHRLEVKGEDGDLVESTEEDYFVQIHQLLDILKSDKIRKAILSRINVQEGIRLKDAPEIFMALAEHYAHAFLFFVHIPGKVSWMGATPETLLQKQKGRLSTMALAGTQAVKGQNISSAVWGRKEVEEQAYVGEFIEENIREFGVEEFQKEGPYTSQAGNLFHLRTDFSLRDVFSKEELTGLIRALHPTPAVCGLPGPKALKVIRELEPHQREYYAGFLGPFEKNGDFSLFVNLRSMKLMQDKIALYVGGGITADSIPEDEWKETCMKAETLLQVIRQIK